MSPEVSDTTKKEPTEFSNQAEEQSVGLIAEFIAFLTHNKKWWLIPIIVVFLLAGLLILIAGSPLGPFVYTLG